VQAFSTCVCVALPAYLLGSNRLQSPPSAVGASLRR
jgi:hypothetical protein